jgi:hypothetical protein
MRWTQALAVIVIVLLVAACGGGGNGNGGDGGGDNGGESQPADGGGGDDGGGDGGGESQPADDGGGDDGGGDGGQTGSFDLDHAFEVLTPPNATEISKTTAQGVIFAAWDTDESLDSLRSFYEDAFDELGLEVITTTEAQGGIAWVVAESEGSSTGGSISIFPASDGTGTQVSVTIGEEV